MPSQVELRSRLIESGSAGNSLGQGSAASGRTSFGYFSWPIKKSDQPPGCPRLRRKVKSSCSARDRGKKGKGAPPRPLWATSTVSERWPESSERARRPFITLVMGAARYPRRGHGLAVTFERSVARLACGHHAIALRRRALVEPARGRLRDFASDECRYIDGTELTVRHRSKP